MTLSEKIAQTPKLERIDSSIDSCIKILEQELNKRKVEDPDTIAYNNRMIGTLQIFKAGFEIMRGKK